MKLSAWAVYIYIHALSVRRSGGNLLSSFNYLAHPSAILWCIGFRDPLMCVPASTVALEIRIMMCSKPDLDILNKLAVKDSESLCSSSNALILETELLFVLTP